MNAALGSMFPAPHVEELCWRHARRGVAVDAVVRCAFCRQWVCRRCFDGHEGICRTCAAEPVEGSHG